VPTELKRLDALKVAADIVLSYTADIRVGRLIRFNPRNKIEPPQLAFRLAEVLRGLFKG